MELAPFNVKAILVIPGSVVSDMAANEEIRYSLPPNSLFKSYYNNILAVLRVSQGKGSIPTDKFAKYVVGKIMKDKLPFIIRRGGWSKRYQLLGRMPRTWALSLMTRQYMHTSR